MLPTLEVWDSVLERALVLQINASCFRCSASAVFQAIRQFFSAVSGSVIWKIAFNAVNLPPWHCPPSALSRRLSLSLVRNRLQLGALSVTNLYEIFYVRVLPARLLVRFLRRNCIIMCPEHEPSGKCTKTTTSSFSCSLSRACFSFSWNA